VEVVPGSHGLSNHLLDTDWPKVHAGRARLAEILRKERLDADALLGLLTERSTLPGDMPPDADDGEIRRHLMNHYFIVSPTYGTRSSTVVLLYMDGTIEFVERRFTPDGSPTGTSRFLL
jgi:uncharacterized protein with NRDE domain